MKTDPCAKTAISSLCDQLVRGTAEEEAIIAALQECQEALDAGQPIDRAALLEKYSHVATELSECLDGLELIFRSGPEDRSRCSVAEVLADSDLQTAGTNRRIGDFEIRGELGRGGMGVVYEAEQISVGRRVALKVLPFAAMLDEKKIARFQHEARAAATLEHPHIVPVYSVGNERGVYYYAMRLIDGKNLAEIANDLQGLENQDGHRSKGSEIVSNLVQGVPTVAANSEASKQDTVTTKNQKTEASWMDSHGTSSRVYYDSIARLGLQTAEALEFAHSNGVLHRDIKPANIMLDQTGDAWITDFGLARIESAAAMTMTGDLVGTLRYMSPEQSMAKRVAVDHRSDVYSLGATLYELLTFHPLFEAPDRAALLHDIAFSNPVSPSTIRPTIPRDLETIVLKALEKNPNDRYASAQLMADDLERFISRHPIAAKPPGLHERTRKWVQRNPSVAAVVAVSACVIAIASSLATGIVSNAFRSERRQREIAEGASRAAASANLSAQHSLSAERSALRDAQRNLYQAHVREAFDHLSRGRVRRAETLLYSHLPQVNESDHRDWEWFYLLSNIEKNSVEVTQFHSSPTGITINPTNTLVAAVDFGSTLRIWDSQAETSVQEHHVPYARFRGLKFSPDGGMIAISSSDGSIRLWDVKQQEWITRLSTPNPAATQRFENPTWSPGGKRLALATFKAIVVWDVEFEKELLRIPASGIQAVDWSPDGSKIAFGSWGDLIIADANSGEQLRKFKQHQHDLWSIDWNSDGTKLATGAFDHHSKIVDAETGEILNDFVHHTGVNVVQYSPDEKYIAVGTCSNEVVVWDIENNSRAHTFAGHRSWVNCVSWNHDCKTLLSGSSDHSIRKWKIPDHDAQTTYSVAHNQINVDCGIALLKPAQREHAVCDVSNNQILHRFAASRACLSPNGDRIAAKLGGSTKILESRTGRCNSEFQTPHGHRLVMGWSSDGKRVATINSKGVHFWDPLSGNSLWQTDSPQKDKQAVWAPKEPLIAIQSGDTVNVWDAESLQLVSSFSNPKPMKSLGRVGWSPNGEIITTCGGEGIVRLWNSRSGQLVHELVGHTSDRHVYNVAWSHDCSLLATGGWDQTVKIWDSKSGRELHSLRGHTSTLFDHGIAFNLTGTRLATVDDGGTIKLWDPLRGEEVLTLAENQLQTILHWSADGKALVASRAGKYPTNSGATFAVYHAGMGYELESSGNLEFRLAAEKQALARFLLRSNRIKEFEVALREAEGLAKFTAATHLWWGRMLAIRGMTDLAQKHFENGAGLPDCNCEVRNELAWLLANRHDKERREPVRAERIAKGLVAESPKQGEFWTTLGAALLRQDKWQESLDALDHAVKHVRLGKSQIYWMRAVCLVELGMLDEAENCLEEAEEAWEFEEGYDDNLTYDNERFRAEALSRISRYTESK